MDKFNVDKFLQENDPNEWYRVPEYLVNNLKLNAEELDFAKKLYVGYFVKHEDVDIPADRILEIIRDINLELMMFSDGYYVIVLPEGYRMYRLSGSLQKLFLDWDYQEFTE